MLAFTLLVTALVTTVAFVPALSGHDLPQHFAYARLLGDSASNSLAADFEPPFGDDPYFATYWALVLLARWMPLDAAMRVVFAVYLVAMSLAGAALSRAVAEKKRGEPHWPIVLSPLFALNPVVCMGFLPFMLALPVVVGGAAAALRFSAPRRPWIALALVGLAGAGLASLHLGALAMLALVLACIALARRNRAAWGALALAVGAAACTLVWYAHRLPTAEPFDWERLRFNVRTFGLADGIVATFRLSWAPASAHAKMALATLLGPFPGSVKALIAVAFVLLAVTVVVTARAKGRPSRSRAAFLIATLIFVAATFASPTAIQVPDDMCLIEFRLYVLVFVFLASLVPESWFHARASQLALCAVSVLVVSTWTWALFGAGGEAHAASALAERLGKDDRVLALSFHDQSDYLDEENAVLHYLPVMHTALNGGTTTLFWGKFSRHLPIGYRPGREPPHPLTWKPEEWNPAQLRAATHVLVSLPTADDSLEKQRAAARLLEQDGRAIRRVACDGNFCLFKVAAATRTTTAERASQTSHSANPE